MFIFNYNIILIIISTLIATISAQTCPQNWWPLSISNSLLNDVVKGNNIIKVDEISLAKDRIDTSSSNLNAVYIKGDNTDTNNDNAKYVSYLTLPAGTYFSSTSFTITFWINVKKMLAADKIARVLDFSDTAAGADKQNSIAVYLKQGSTTTNTVVTLESIVKGVAQTVSDTGAGFAAEWTHVAITVSTSGSPVVISSAIYYNGNTTDIKLSSATVITNLAAITTNFTTNFIGKGAKPGNNEVNLDAQLNDVKIFNSALTATQVSTQYTSEKSTRTYTCSSSSINPQNYLYIVLFSILGSFV